MDSPVGPGEIQRCEAAAVFAMRPRREGAAGVGDGGGEQRLVDHRARGPAAGGSGTGRETAHVVRPSGLRSGPAQALAAEGLRAHHRADLVAIDVDVARAHAVDDVLHAIIDARVQAEGEPVAGSVDGVDDGVDLVGPERGDVQHRPEDFLFERPDAIDPQHCRRHEGAVPRRRELLEHASFLLGLRTVRFDAGLRVLVDHRADVRGEVPGVADAKLVHGAPNSISRIRSSTSRWI